MTDQMITGQLDVEHRRLAHRRIGPYYHRQEIKGGLIYISLVFFMSLCSDQ